MELKDFFILDGEPFFKNKPATIQYFKKYDGLVNGQTVNGVSFENAQNIIFGNIEQCQEFIFISGDFMPEGYKYAIVLKCNPEPEQIEAVNDILLHLLPAYMLFNIFAVDEADFVRLIEHQKLIEK